MKRVRDNVHGTITLSRLAQRIINTNTFKRLKNLKQLGNCHELYPTANHDRFEHSLGVMHLAREAIEKLRASGADITEAEQLCVEIGGLCHDLGHGPISHLWERFTRASNEAWEHEKSSLAMLDLIIEEDSIDISEYGLSAQDLVFIKEIIDGPMDRERVKGGYPYQGRGPEKYYLYEIISNKITGVDVDKFDYFLRDSQAAGLKINFEYTRVLDDMKIVEWPFEESNVSVMRIAYRDKAFTDCQKMFYDRFMLHHECYQHKKVKVVDTMMVDAWIKANPYFPKLMGLKLSEYVRQARALRTLTDYSVTQGILDLTTPEPGLEEAKEILQRIIKRDFYKLMAEITEVTGTTDQMLEAELGTSLAVARTVIDYGQKDKNPVTSMLFHDKNGKVFTKTDAELKNFVPKEIAYEKVYVFLRDKSPTSEAEAVKKLKKLRQNNKDINVTLPTSGE